VTWNELCPNYRALGIAQAILDDGMTHVANVGKTGGFRIPDVPSGEHVLSIRAHDHVFEQVLVQISSDGNNLSKVLPVIPGTAISASSPRLPYPIKLAAMSRYDYYVPHETFNILAMFGNPMMLMMVVGAVLLFATPYLSKYVDQEGMKEGPTGSANYDTTPTPETPPLPKQGTGSLKEVNRRPPASSNVPKGRSNKSRKR